MADLSSSPSVSSAVSYVDGPIEYSAADVHPPEAPPALAFATSTTHSEYMGQLQPALVYASSSLLVPAMQMSIAGPSTTLYQPVVIDEHGTMEYVPVEQDANMEYVSMHQTTSMSYVSSEEQPSTSAMEHSPICYASRATSTPMYRTATYGVASRPTEYGNVLNLIKKPVQEIGKEEFTFKDVIGQGSFSFVYVGKWQGKTVAIKHAYSESSGKAFEMELEQLQKVDHKNIIKLYAVCREIPSCLIMEYSANGSLYDLVHRRLMVSYSLEHAISWMRQCAMGLEYLHSISIVHRDIKSSNLLLFSDGLELKICDFGAAVDLNTHFFTNVEGSVHWMAPETFQSLDFSEKSDVYSWAIVFWEAMTRRMPFDDIEGNYYELMWAIISGERPPFCEFHPAPLVNIISMCWEESPDNRPYSHTLVEMMEEVADSFCAPITEIDFSGKVQE